MTSAIQTLPPGSTAGLDFNYSQWTPGTMVQLANVPWDAQYRDVVRFPNGQADLDTYLTTPGVAGPVISHMSNARMGAPVRINLPMNKVLGYNYLRAYNPAQPVKQGDTPKAFYYFITDVAQLAPNTTHITVQLDVFQTFGYGVQFGRCYVERGHVGIANVNDFQNNGKDYLTVPEGFDLGNEYDVNRTYSYDITPAELYSVLVVSTVDLLADPGSVSTGPKLNTATGSSFEGLPNGCALYLAEDLPTFQSWLADFSDKPWVTEGIISVTAIPNKGFFGMTATGTGKLKRVDNTKLQRNKVTVGPAGWRDDIVPERYRHLNKFKTYPYSHVEMTSFTGTPLLLKPECMPSDLSFIMLAHFAPPSPRISFYPLGYNTNPGTTGKSGDSLGTFYDGGEFLNMSTGIFNLPTFSVLNNGYMSFLASNHNGIAFQHQSADWSQQRALAGNQTSFDQATSSVNANTQQAQIGINAATAQTNLANLSQGMHTVVNGAATLIQTAGVGAVGVAANVGNMAIDINQRNQALGISSTAAAQGNMARNTNAEFARDTNKSLADWAAKGDNQNAIAGINARVQDAKLTQPSVSGQVGGDAFLLANYKWGVDFRIRGLQSGVMAAIGEFWLRYGYAINRFTVPPADLRCMTNFTYWKLRETYLTGGPCPETFKNTIRGIFEKGVTVWTDPTNIGFLDIGDNIPMPEVVL